MYMEYTILGMLAQEDLTGYDLKKKMQASTFMYWSGNNNQIYKALVQLGNKEYVTSTTVHQDGSPSKKVYQITDRGRAAIDQWVLGTPPEPPEFRKPFLLQLAAAGNLGKRQILQLLTAYGQQLNEYLAMEQEKRRRTQKAESGLEYFLKDKIHENVEVFYQSELDWLHRFAAELQSREEF